MAEMKLLPSGASPANIRPIDEYRGAREIGKTW
jgi:hypothetical protein